MAVSDAPFLSVVVPCYNEECVIEEFFRRMAAACTSCEVYDHEIIFVDDGSSDGTWAKIERLHSSSPHIVGIRLLRNHGHQLAVTAGLSKAIGQYILLIDADLQDPPELLAAMLAEAARGADVVYGQRLGRKGETLFKRLSAKVFYRLIARLTEVPIPLDTGDFRLINRKVADVLLSMPEQQRFIRGMVSWIGGRQVALPYVRDPRFAGTTKYPLRKMLRFAIDAVTSFSTSPLRMATWLSFVGGLFSVVILLYAFAQWLLGNTVQGWTSVVGTIGLFGSLQLLVLGVIGEYVGRLFVEQKCRPLFLIDHVLTRSASASTSPYRPAVSARTSQKQTIEHAAPPT